MPTDHRTCLADIRRFDHLVAYLRDEMGWPIETDNFEDLTFEYSPEELGIDAKNAAKIQEIKRLRPLTASQPWGIFFVKFEPKRLPVVALRRILGQVTLKKRASANKAQRQAWAPDDLLFISNYGESGERRIAFAHFANPTQETDLPTLKVLGWDNLDTPLHLDDVAEKLTHNLAWPTDPNNREAWRQRWREAFPLRHREVITKSKELAVRLAELARDIRDRIMTALAIETEKGPLTRLMKAFQAALIHDLDADGFADMYAQTIAYGLLSARIADPHRKTADDFAAHMRTNPFLRELMETFLKVGGRRGRAGGLGIDFDELGVSEVVELLDDANMEAIVRDFGDRNPQEDPVIHFYELFLKEYDAKKRMQRGVFYTPRPVVTYIVRSVDELLRTEFGLADGFADTTTWGEIAKRHKDLKIPEGVSADQDFVQILDPATGTGTFLVEVIDLIHTTLVAKWKAKGHGEKKIDALWNEYVPKHLLTRLHGYELLMAPYAIAHLKIGLKLHETGYSFGSEERARVYLTNALEPAGDGQLSLDFLPALAHEAQAVNEIKGKQRFTVVIGNPPYAGLSSNMGPWIDGLLKGRLPDGSKTASYYHVDGERLGEKKVWLQDDYVKFIRLSQWLLDRTGAGVHGYISNHGYLDNPTFRGMRWSLLQSFPRIRVLDLHGNMKKKEIPPGGGRDVNVFDIQQGVAIGLFSKSWGNDSPVRHADLWGERERKYAWLLDHGAENTTWTELDAAPPYYLFEPFDASTSGTYYGWPPVNEIMPVNVTGIVTARDEFVIDFDREALRSRIQDMRTTALSDAAIREKYFKGKGAKKYPAGDSRGWKLPEARKKLRADNDWDKRYAQVLYRPFDIREMYYVPWMVDWPRTEVMPQMLAGQNVALVVCRQSIEGWGHVLASMRITDDSMVSNRTRERGYVCPLYLYPKVGSGSACLFSRWPQGKRGRTPNLDLGFVDRLAEAVGLSFVSDGRGDLESVFGPEDIVAYIYAVFHSPGFRERYESQLKLDFPRVPLPGMGVLFTEVVDCGHELLALHLLESPKLDRPATEYLGQRAPEVEKVSWLNNTVWLDKSQTTGFKGVREEVWNFQIGGYLVCQKWLKDRKGRTLSKGDIVHYQKIIVALSETIRLMKKIDEVIEQHGGWPRAFAAGAKAKYESTSTPLRKVAEGTQTSFISDESAG